MNALCPLLRLPQELRDEIVEFVFSDFDQERLRINRHHDVTERTIKAPRQALPPICIASQQLYLETTPLFLNRIKLASNNVATTCWLCRWLATLPAGRGYRSVRHLAFRNFHGLEQIKGIELIALCPNVRSLNIMLGDEYSDPGNVPSMALSTLSSAINAYENLDNIILMYQLHRLIEIPNLEVLEFGFHNWELPVSSIRARQVKQWFVSKFQAKGRSVHVVCKQMQWGRESATDDVDEVMLQWYG
jgi:hypothetical protein